MPPPTTGCSITQFQCGSPFFWSKSIIFSFVYFCRFLSILSTFYTITFCFVYFCRLLPIFVYFWLYIFCFVYFCPFLRFELGVLNSYSRHYEPHCSVPRARELRLPSDRVYSLDYKPGGALNYLASCITTYGQWICNYRTIAWNQKQQYRNYKGNILGTQKFDDNSKNNTYTLHTKKFSVFPRHDKQYT